MNADQAPVEPDLSEFVYESVDASSFVNVKAWSKPTSSTTSSVWQKSSSVSPGKPTITSVVKAMSGIAARYVRFVSIA